MRGTSVATGKAIEGVDHLTQSISDILTTPLGSRVMRRDYGSLLPRLIDQPFNGPTQILLFAAIAGALMRWEPRLQLSRVSLALGDAPGAVVITLEGTRTDTPQPSAAALTVPLQL